MSLTVALVCPGQGSARAATGAEQGKGAVSDALCAVSSRAPVRELVRDYSVRIKLSRDHPQADKPSIPAQADKHAEEEGGGHLQNEAEQDQGAAWAQTLEAGGALGIVEYLEALLDLELVPQAVSVDAAVEAFEDLQSDIGACGKVHLEQFKQLFLMLSSGPYDNEAAAKLLEAERDWEQEQERADAAAARTLLLNDGMAQDEAKLLQRQAAAADACLARSIEEAQMPHLQHSETQGPPRGGGLAEIDVDEHWSFGHHVSDKQHLCHRHSPPAVKTHAVALHSSSLTPAGKGRARDKGQGQNGLTREEEEAAFWSQLGHSYCHIRYSRLLLYVIHSACTRHVEGD